MGCTLIDLAAALMYILNRLVDPGNIPGRFTDNRRCLIHTFIDLLDVFNLLFDLLGCLGRLLGQGFDFTGDHGKALSGLSGSGASIVALRARRLVCSEISSMGSGYGIKVKGEPGTDLFQRCHPCQGDF